jgi:hypothetical protein
MSELSLVFPGGRGEDPPLLSGFPWTDQQEMRVFQEDEWLLIICVHLS